MKALARSAIVAAMFLELSGDDVEDRPEFRPRQTWCRATRRTRTEESGGLVLRAISARREQTFRRTAKARKANLSPAYREVFQINDCFLY
jgi:hypothetical protein